MSGKKIEKYFVLFACSILLAVVLEGCKTHADKRGQSQLAAARRQFSQNRYPLAQNTLNRFIDSYSKSIEAAEAYYLRALCYREMGTDNSCNAEDDFRLAISKASDEDVKYLAYAGLGHLYFEQGGSAQTKAIELYRAALEGMAADKPKDVVLYRLGVALQNNGQWKEADSYFSSCFGEFVDSEYANKARLRFGMRVFRIQVGAFGQLHRAMEKVVEMNKTHWQADWSSLRRDGKVLYAVRTGQYNTLTEATDALRAIAAVEDEAFIVTGRAVRK